MAIPNVNFFERALTDSTKKTKKYICKEVKGRSTNEMINLLNVFFSIIMNYDKWADNPC
jgi:hypothetical protein